jgi:HK97 family phage prohead protease
MREFRRAIDTDIEHTGRVLEGITLRWNRRYRVSDDNGATYYVEGWRQRAFEKGLRATGNTHEVRVDHRDVRVGRVSFAESSEGLVFTAIADDTPDGDAVLEYADAGRFRGVSLCYWGRRQQRAEDGTLWRTEAVPRELSLIDRGVPQYEDAGVMQRRALTLMVDADETAQAEAAQLAALLERSARNIAIDIDVLPQ